MVFMRIAIVKLSALGDIVHAMVVLQFIKEYNLNISIDWIVEEDYKELLELNSHINKIYTVNLKKAKKKKSLLYLLKELKKVRRLQSYDIVIDMQGLIKSAIISRLIPSKKTVGFDKFSTRESIASLFYSDTFYFDYNKNVIIRNFELSKFALGFSNLNDEINYKLPLFTSKLDYQGDNISKINKNILIIPGASSVLKCYPPDKFAEYTNLINANFILSWGSKEERINAELIKTESPNVKICERMSLHELISLIKKVDLVIGSDTGPTHFAWALNIPSITLFGPTSGKRNAFSTNINKIIESDTFVNPSKLNKNDSSIKTINIQEVVKISKSLLDTK